MIYFFTGCIFCGPSKGVLTLKVGGRTKEQAIDNWYRLAKPLRRILKEVRVQTAKEQELAMG